MKKWHSQKMLTQRTSNTLMYPNNTPIIWYLLSITLIDKFKQGALIIWMTSFMEKEQTTLGLYA